MKKSLPLFFAVAFALILTGVARAGDMKFPEKTDPAFAFTLPEGWKSAPDAENLALSAPDHYCSIVLGMIEDEGVGKASLDVISKTMLQSASAKGDGRKEEAELGGKKGIAYYGIVNAPTGATLNAKLIIVVLDDKHLASLLVLTDYRKTDADDAALEKALASVKFTGVK